MSLPVGLSYQTRAIKVDDEDGPVGVGWDLQSGGIVSRRIVGRPDEMSGTQICTGTPTLEYLTGLYYYSVDGDYDRYNYQAGEYTGTFIIVEGEIIQLPETDVKIVRSEDNTFRIIVPDGTEYVYDITESVSYSYVPIELDNKPSSPNYNNAICSWRLSRIINPSRTDSIMFEYIDLPTRVRYTSSKVSSLSSNNLDHEYIHISYGSDLRGTTQHLYTYENRHALHRITSRAGTINFIDADEEPVKGFTVNTPTGTEVRRVSFAYTTYRSLVKEEIALLTDVTITSGGTTIDSAEFEYNTPGLYMGNRDIFGYNNYQAGKTYNCESVLTAKIPEDTTDVFEPVVPEDGPIISPGNNGDSISSTERARVVISDERLPYFDALQSKTLKSVTTHSGAKTEFEYESNETDKHFVIDGTEYALAPGLRIKRERVTDANTGSVRVKEYTYSGGKSTIDFSKISYGAFIGLSGNRSVVMPFLSMCYTTGAVMLASSRMPGATLENAAVYYSDVRETITGTGLEAPIITDYQFDLTDVESPFVIAGKPSGIPPGQEDDERICGTHLNIPAHPQFVQAYTILLSPHKVGGYFKEKFVEKAQLQSKTEWVTDASGTPVRKFRTTEYSYFKNNEEERTVGYYCDPIVRTVKDNGSYHAADDFRSIEDFNYFPVKIASCKSWCDSVKVTEYDVNGNSRTVITAYEYLERSPMSRIGRGDIIELDSTLIGGGGLIPLLSNHYSLVSKITKSCEGDSYSTEYTYSANSLDETLSTEALRGRISMPVSEKFRHGEFMMEKRFHYKDFGTVKENVHLSSVVCAVDGNVPTDSISMPQYDIYGNPLEMIEFSGLKHKYVWGGNGTYMQQSSIDGNLATQYEYRPLVGYSKITTPSGTASDYAYTSGRLTSQSIAGENVATYSYSQYGDNQVNKIVVSHPGVNGGAVSQVSRYDAFGNQLLSGISGGISGASIVNIIEYDIFGRKLKEYFPIPAEGVDENIETLAQSAPTAYSGDSQPFVKTAYNRGADTRERSITLGGSEFASHPMQFNYRFNTETGDINSCRRYRISGNTLHLDGNYTAGTLEIRESTDGDGRKVLQFTDFSGKTILTRAVSDEGNADTYSVYDDAGNLVLVLPPLATESLSAVGASYDISTNEALLGYADYYRYDECQLLVEQRMGGTEPIYYHHDKAGRVIFTQDGEQRARGVMGFAINDIYGRIALEGETLATPQLIAQVKNMHPYALRSETLAGRHAGYGVSIGLFNSVVNKAYYYDDYSALTEGVFSQLNERLSSSPLTIKRSNNKGLLTATLTRVTTPADFDGSISPTTSNSLYTASVYGYDNRERVAESVEVDYNGVAIVERTSYSGADLPLVERIERTDTAGVVTTVSHQYLYDNLDRKISVTTTVDGEEVARTATTYDDKGRVATTTMSDVRTDNINALNYGYLVNGSVKSISTSNGKFEMTLGFASGMYPSYSGNVSSMSWRGGDGVNRIYNYRYDKLNRLISAEYYEANRTSRSDISYMGSPDYDTSYSYDLHGNVKTISRKGMTGLTPGANNMIVSYGNTDNLTLSYTGNRLKSVTDTSSRIYYTGATDFDDAADYDTEYEYDYNGNVTVDRNRRIVGAVYNSLNQPMRIEMEDGAEIENIYDADGTLRQRKHIGSDDTEIAVTDYSGVWELKNGALSRINIPGGYIQGDSVYFYIADRQGNIRQVWNASTGQTVQDNHYYPYGAMFGESAAVEYVNAMAGTNNMVSINAEVSTNPYRYGGKEWLMQEGLNYYDFAARQYDPTTGRFIHPDPLNGKYPHLSSYLYCAGNPINATDPTGMKFIFRQMSDEEKEEFLRFGDKDYLQGNLPELYFLYQLIESVPNVFIVDYVDVITDSNGESIPIQLEESSINNENNLNLQISRSNPPHTFNLLEDLFHCFQQINASKYKSAHNFEYEAKLFANIAIKGSEMSAVHDFPYFTDILSLLGFEGQNVGYKLGFKFILNSVIFRFLYQDGVNKFIEYNTINNTGNDEYRAPSKSPPFSLLLYYKLFKIKNYIK